MTYTFHKNILLQSDPGYLLFDMKTRLFNAGWQVRSSGDGISNFSMSSDVISHNGTGANGSRNANAWIVLRIPNIDGYVREILLQRYYKAPVGPSAGVNRLDVYYGFNSPFVGGSPSATTKPTATGQIYIGSILMPENTNSFYGIGDASEKYSFFFFSIDQNGNRDGKVFLCFDYLQENSYIAADIDPVVWWKGTTSFNYNSINSWAYGWFAKGHSLEFFGQLTTYTHKTYGGSNITSSTGIQKNYTGNTIDLFPIFIGRGSDKNMPRGLKGISRVLRLFAVTVNNGDTLSITSPKDKIVINNLALPWDGSSPII
jgi:hypothetical protein